MAKSKFSFTLDGVKYTDITGYQYSGSTAISVNVAGTAQMIRQYMKQKYPNIPSRDYYWVQSQSYAGGDSIRVYLNDAPEELYKKLDAELNAKFEEGKFDGMTDSYTYTKGKETAAEGMLIDYGTKYLFVENRKPYDSEAEAVNWDDVLSSKKAAPSQKTGSPTASKFSRGEKLKECAGWEIYKKTLPDGRIVYGAYKKASTPPNKEDWNAIKGEVYVETGFKWGKFGSFEKWGSLEKEEDTLKMLCNVLDKYYVSGETGAEDNERKKVEYFVYGVNWNVPFDYGKELIQNLLGRGYKLISFIGSRQFGIFKTSSAKDGIVVVDNGGEFNIEDYSKLDVISTINYVENDKPVEVSVLADLIDDIYKDYYLEESPAPAPEPQPAPAPAPAAKSKEDIEKAIKGLQYLADKGNEKAIKAIKGLQYLLNK